MPETLPRDQHHLIRFRGDPTPYFDDPRNAGEFYRVFGMYLVAWGRFETHFLLDLVTITILTWATAPSHQIPLAWSKRSDIWKKAFRNLPALEPHKDTALKLMTDILLAAKDRNVLVHSGWGGFLSDNPLTLECINVRSDGDYLEVGNLPIALPRIMNLINTANVLNQRLLPISTFLSSLRPPPESAQPILRPRESLLTPRRPATRE